MTFDPADIARARVTVAVAGQQGDHHAMAAAAVASAALDEIDRLTGQLAVVRAERDEAREGSDCLAVDLNAARARVDEMIRVNDEQDALYNQVLRERNTAIARVAELEAQRDRLAAQLVVVDKPTEKAVPPGLAREREAAFVAAVTKRMEAETVGPEPRYGDGAGGLVCKRCGLDWPNERDTLDPHACPPGFARIADLVRALPDAEPPAGYVERAEVRRLEVAVVEAVLAYTDAEDDPSNRFYVALHETSDALRAARDRAGKAGG